MAILRDIAKGINNLLTIKSKDTISSKEFNRRIKNLEKRGYVNLGGDFIKLSNVGRNFLEHHDICDICVQPVKWDGVWRIIAYDIPDKMKGQRDYFRKKLKEAGAYQVQKSMWTTPYECKEKIAIFAKRIGINNYVIYLTTDKIPNQKKVMKIFGI